MDAVAVAQGVIGDIQDMIGFVIGEMNLEHMEALVDAIDETDLLGEQMKSADAAVADTVNALGNLVVNVGGREDGPMAADRSGFIETTLDSALASTEAIS